MFDFILETNDWITLGTSIVALIVSIVTYIKASLYECKKMTIEAYIALQESLYFIYEYKKDEIEDFVDDRESAEYKALSSCLAMIEMYAIGIKNKVYNYKIFYSMAHGFIDGSIRSKIEYLIDLKNEYNDSKYYVNTRELLLRMDKTSNKKCKKKFNNSDFRT